jgi:putative ABC transport system substrate-binding protein
MRRRAFIATLGGAAVWPLAARAEPQSAATIGLLAAASLPDWAIGAIRAGLSEAGYDESRNLTIISRSAEGHFDRLPELAAELVNSHVAAILATGSPVPARSAKAATTTIPIVFAYGGDPVVDGLVASLNQPGGNVTGATFIGSALLAKRIELLHQIAPQASDIALLVNPKGTLAERQIKDAEVATRTLGLHLHIINTSTLGEVDTAFVAMSEQKVGAFVVSTDPFFGFIGRDTVLALAARDRIPAIYNARDETSAGGLVSYGPKLADTWRQAGVYVGRILKGEKPSDLPAMAADQVRDGHQSQGCERARTDDFALDPQSRRRSDRVA